jgi:hypothetical protein
LQKLETNYGFYLEHYVKHPSEINYLRLFTVLELVRYNQSENNENFLSEKDMIWLESLTSYIMIQWYSTGQDLFMRTINHELLSKISFNLDSRNIWEANKKKKSFDMVVYSAHDSSLLFFYNILGLNSLKCLQQLIMKADSQGDFSSSELNSCVYSVDYADNVRVEMAKINNKIMVVLRRQNSYYKIPIPNTWGSLKVCGRLTNI